MSVLKDSISKVIKVDRNTHFETEGISLAIGFFDGLHLGHQALIKEALDSEYMPCVLTFSDEFKSALSGKARELLRTAEEKEKVLLNSGIQKIFILPYKDSVVHSSIETFLDFLTNRNVRKIVVGKDFTFGDKGIGKPMDLLRREDRGCEVVIKDLMDFEYKGTKQKISSSAIKQLLKDKGLEEAHKLLGYPYIRTGKVIKGHQNGRKIGFPTAIMLKKKKKICLPEGVYQTVTLVEGKWYPSRTNIGNHPTIDEEDKTIIETNIFGVDFDLYGLNITVSFIRYLRDQTKFDSMDDLKRNLEQLKEEILLGSNNDSKRKA